jgi:hypothetical protein
MNCEHHPPTDDLKSMEPRCNGTDRLKPMVKLYKTIILQVVLYGCETWSLTQKGVRENGSKENIWTEKG